MLMPKTRVLVVDDSAFMRKVIADIIDDDPELEVVGKARDGLDALDKVRELKPDVITLDVEMPNMDGLTALGKIMEINPLPVIMLSSVTKTGTEQTVKALQLGAVDFIAKPSGHISLDIESVKDDIIRKIKTAAGTKKKLTNFNIKEVVSAPRPEVKIAKKAVAGRQLNKLVLIGTSTGGPKALHQVVPELPGNLDAAVLIVQHMPPGFTRSLAERLDSLSQIRVKEAEHGETIVPGCAYIAPGDFHLTVCTPAPKTLQVSLNKSEPRGGLRPAADVMFDSAAQQFWSHIVCVIMTGMGRDGSEGLLAIKRRGGKIIAEHQSTSIVYGMPKAAFETGQVDLVVPLPEISKAIVNMLL
jgi:two-component system chemotaxis response regulator CheB